ncbi:ribose 5-phosphate isomerase A [Halobacillus shinanisalinarum]|uniref:ribose 5-phosphate isomerase A n=1 Tax=Halobacillus shinanisalinarum TaxID=2932258 RepID=UPI0029624547|nr:ribose 5-phosphate isomerase A [Halobacillus shinanisalinarum]
MLEVLGKRVKEGMNIQGVPTSKKTERLGRTLGIPLTPINENTCIDVAIDGADEIAEGQLVKGGGGSLVREKIIDAYAGRLIIIADSTKVVPQLGAFPLPVEVVPFGWQMTAAVLESLGCRVQLRTQQNEIFLSDNGNYIVDCHFTSISDPAKLHAQINQIAGVVENGLFINMATDIFVGNRIIKGGN